MRRRLRPQAAAVRVVAVGLLAMVATGCGVSLQQMPKLGGAGQPTYSITAQFANVQNLPIGGQVRIGPVVVGEVGSISVRHFQADVLMQIYRRVAIPRGTTAEVRFDDPLGDQYVLLQTPVRPGPPLRAGATICLTQTGAAPSVEDTLGALATVLNGGGIGSLGTIVREANEMFSGNQAQIRSLLSTITAAVTSLAHGAGTLDTSLASVASLFQQLNQGNATIVHGISTIGPAIGVLASENGQFGQLLSGLTELGGIANSVANQSGESSVKAVQSLLPVVQQVVGIESHLGPDLNDIAAFESDTPKVGPGNYLQVALTLDGRINSNPVQASATAAPGSSAAAVSQLLGAGLP